GIDEIDTARCTEHSNQIFQLLVAEVGQSGLSRGPAGSVQRSASIGEGDRRARSNADDRTDLPSSDRKIKPLVLAQIATTSSERQLIDRVHVENVSLIIVCTSVVQALIIVIEEWLNTRLCRADSVGQLFRERVVRLQSKTAREPAPQFELSCVVVV